MRYSILTSLWLSFYWVVIWPYGFFICEDICENNELQEYHRIVLENESYHYSLHYSYSIRIRRNQLHPIVTGRFKKFTDNQIVTPKFPLNYYDNHVNNVDISSFGTIGFHVGLVNIDIPGIYTAQSEILNKEELVAVRWSIEPFGNALEITARVTCLIQRNGKIAIYFENISTEIPENDLQAEIFGDLKCNLETKRLIISVPSNWIKSGTLVEYEVIGTTCSKYTTNKECRKARTSETTCIWCDKGDACIASNDQDTHMLKVNDCHNETSSEVIDLSTTTHIKNTEVTSGVTDVQTGGKLMETSEETAQPSNMTTKTIEGSELNKSFWYLYIVIPLIISLFLLCIGCLIWFWMHQKK